MGPESTGVEVIEVSRVRARNAAVWAPPGDAIHVAQSRTGSTSLSMGHERMGAVVRRLVRVPAHGEDDSFLRRSLRVTWLAAHGFWNRGAISRASELAFDTVLALVPLLAILFSALRGLGVYDSFVAGTLKPWMERTFNADSGAEQHGLVTLHTAFARFLELDRGPRSPPWASLASSRSSTSC